MAAFISSTIASGVAKKVAVQVKSGHTSVNHGRDLKGVIHREKAAKVQ